MKSGHEVMKTFHRVRKRFKLAFKRMGKGDHAILHNRFCRNFTVPLQREIKPGLLLSIIYDAGMTREEFLESDP